MAFKRPLSVSPIRHDQAQDSSPKGGTCQICGDIARIVNYGALSCSSCKTFFRRQGFHSENVPSCRHNNNCHITKETRKYCTACRFSKCLAAGMSPTLIRKEDLYEKHRRSITPRYKLLSQEITSVPQPCLLNLLSHDLSSLTSTNWRLLSNIVHAFDTYNCVSDTKTTLKSVDVTPINIQGNIEITMNMIASVYTALQSIVSCTADFRIMTTAEQCSLMQRNMQGIVAVYCMLVFRECGILDGNHFKNTLLPLYGDDNVRTTKRISLQIDYDVTLVKLMLVTLTFSSNCFTITERNNETNDSLLYGTFRLFGSQNVYAEVLWRYMLYKYGFWEAVRRFDALIKIALDSIKLSSDIYDSNQVHQDFTDEISELSERALKLNDSENVPLWGNHQC